jgi:multisubunit Na+/H+ antiporter MnhB subunit
MKKTIKTLGLFALPVIAVSAVLVGGVAFAGSITDGGLTGGVGAARPDDVPPTIFGDGGIFTTVVNVLLFIIGALSVIMLIYGGIRYTISGGDSNAVTSAKNTILYAIIGLVVAILAYAIVNFVLGELLN